MPNKDIVVEIATSLLRVASALEDSVKISEEMLELHKAAQDQREEMMEQTKIHEKMVEEYLGGG